MARPDLTKINPLDTVAVEFAARELRRQEMKRLAGLANAWLRRKVADLRETRAHRPT